MTDEDILAYARKLVRKNYGRNLNSRRYRRKIQMYVRKFELQRENLRKVAADGPDRKKGVLVYGPHVKGVHGSSVDSRSEGNMIRGLCKRIGSRQEYDIHEIRRFGRFVEDYVREHFTPLPHIPMSHEFLDEAWLDGSKYNQEKKREFHDLLEEFMHSNGDESKIMQCKVFIKREITEEVKEPRIISSRTDTYKAIVAPYIRLIEDAVYDEHFIKHCNPEQVRERLHRVLSNFEYFYETDYSSFEASFSKEFIWQCERRLFRHMLTNNPEIWRLVELAERGDNILVCPQLWAELPGSRMSGEMWTSLANGFSNMMMIRYMAHRLSSQKGFRYDFIVEGDDGLIGTTSKFDLSIVQRLGFRLTLREGSSINDLSFCGMILGPSDRLYCNPERTMIKYGRTMDMRIISRRKSPRFEELLDSEMYTKALSMSVYGSNNPVINQVIRQSLKNVKHRVVRMESLDYWETDILEVQKHWDPQRIRELDDMDYQFAEEAFGITSSELHAIEDEILPVNNRCFSLRTHLVSSHEEATPWIVHKT